MPAQSLPGFSSETASLADTTFVENEEIELGGQPTHVITVLHGIRDSGIWALDLQYHSRRNGLGVHIEPVSYGWLGIFLFLSRVRAKNIEERVLKDVNDIFSRYPQASHSLVAHSNGTKITSKIIRQLSYRYKHIFFCGSVCMRTEAPISSVNADHVINDCSPIDIWPLIAQIINPFHYEATGTYGFRRGGIDDRFFRVFHGGCKTKKHFVNQILPVILRNRLPLGEKPTCAIPYGIPTYSRIFFILIMAFIALYFTL